MAAYPVDPKAGVGLPAQFDKGRKAVSKFEDARQKLAAAITKHDADAVANAFATDAVAYDPMYPEPIRGREAIRQEALGLIRGFPDLRFEIVNAIARDDQFGADEVRLTGTNTGPLATPTGAQIPPTNKRIDLRGASIVRLNGRGEVMEERRYYDVGTMLRQLGLVPDEAKEPAAARR
jgi:steroid delta-isomerase-like uncharacterized protein